MKGGLKVLVLDALSELHIFESSNVKHIRGLNGSIPLTLCHYCYSKSTIYVSVSKIGLYLYHASYSAFLNAVVKWTENMAKQRMLVVCFIYLYFFVN